MLPHGDTSRRSRVCLGRAGAYVIGDVHLGEESSVWYGAVLRGDTEPIRIGARTNVQDGCILHADPGFPRSLARDASSATTRSCTGARSRTIAS